jgi:ornithine cyclodeaminase/alanine dehydrogenase-like protein (mu-crystallin family)
VVRVLDRADVACLVSMAEAIAAVREAFSVADRSGAVMPAPFGMYLPDAGGEVHVKGAYLAARLAGEHGAGRDVPLGDW